MKRALVVLAALALGGGCKKKVEEPVDPPPVEAPSVPLKMPAPPQETPPKTAAKDANDGQKALEELDNQIGVEERTLDMFPKSAEHMHSLLKLLKVRAVVLGRISDREKCNVLAEGIVREAPNDASSYVARAEVRLFFRRFADVAADLAKAQKIGASSDVAFALDTVKARLYELTGKIEEALAQRRKNVEEHPNDIEAMTSEAALLGEAGELERAERRFDEAVQEAKKTGTAFQKAHVNLHYGILYERLNRLPRAKQLFENGHEMMPTHVQLASHLAKVLASLGDRPKAIEVMKPFANLTNDPQFIAQLAELYELNGDKAEAEPLSTRAKTRFKELLATHPEAFSEAAARFWLGQGNDPKQALPLAQRNLTALQTWPSYELAMEAALAASDAPHGCDFADQAMKKYPKRMELRKLAAKAYTACLRVDQASAVLDPKNIPK